MSDEPRRGGKTMGRKRDTGENDWFVAPGGAQDVHYQDQMDLYKNFQSKLMLFNFQDVAAHAASVIRLRIE